MHTLLYLNDEIRVLNCFSDKIEDGSSIETLVVCWPPKAFYGAFDKTFCKIIIIDNDTSFSRGFLFKL